MLDILSNAGIKGFKYKDAQTRFSPKGATYNYVVFDDKIVDIAKKYGVSLFAAGSVSLGLMTPQQAQAQENPIGAPKPQPGTPEATADDTASDFLLSREGADLTPAQKAMQQIKQMAARVLQFLHLLLLQKELLARKLWLLLKMLVKALLKRLEQYLVDFLKLLKKLVKLWNQCLVSCLQQVKTMSLYLLTTLSLQQVS